MKTGWWWWPLLQFPVWTLMVLRGNWTPRFPRAWRDRKITVCANKCTHQMKVERVRKDHFELWALPWSAYGPSAPPRVFYFKDEGITWCMGWTGPRVDAFKVAVALGVAA